MERKYTILAILLVVLAFGLVILPEKREQKEIEPALLLAALAENSRYLSVDLVTQRIVENDPTLLLIDLRPADQFRLFSLPGSINLHPDSILSASSLDLFNQPAKDKVMYGNSDLLSEEAWLILTRNSFKQVYLMKGGLNEWFNTIIKEQPANSAASSSDLDLMSFRNAARQFFVGSGEVSKAPVATKKRENIQVIRKAPQASSGGGC